MFQDNVRGTEVKPMTQDSQRNDKLSEDDAKKVIEMIEEVEKEEADVQAESPTADKNQTKPESSSDAN